MTPTVEWHPLVYRFCIARQKKDDRAGFILIQVVETSFRREFLRDGNYIHTEDR
jgi:hypothetical protein